MSGQEQMKPYTVMNDDEVCSDREVTENQNVLVVLREAQELLILGLSAVRLTTDTRNLALSFRDCVVDLISYWSPERAYLFPLVVGMIQKTMELDPGAALDAAKQAMKNLCAFVVPEEVADQDTDEITKGYEETLKALAIVLADRVEHHTSCNDTATRHAAILALSGQVWVGSSLQGATSMVCQKVWEAIEANEFDRAADLAEPLQVLAHDCVPEDCQTHAIKTLDNGISCALKNHIHEAGIRMSALLCKMTKRDDLLFGAMFNVVDDINDCLTHGKIKAKQAQGLYAAILDIVEGATNKSRAGLVAGAIADISMNRGFVKLAERANLVAWNQYDCVANRERSWEILSTYPKITYSEKTGYRIAGSANNGFETAKFMSERQGTPPEEMLRAAHLIYRAAVKLSQCNRYKQSDELLALARDCLKHKVLAEYENKTLSEWDRLRRGHPASAFSNLMFETCRLVLDTAKLSMWNRSGHKTRENPYSFAWTEAKWECGREVSSKACVSVAEEIGKQLPMPPHMPRTGSRFITHRKG